MFPPPGTLVTLGHRDSWPTSAAWPQYVSAPRDDGSCDSVTL